MSLYNFTRWYKDETYSALTFRKAGQRGEIMRWDVLDKSSFMKPDLTDYIILIHPDSVIPNVLKVYDIEITDTTAIIKVEKRSQTLTYTLTDLRGKALGLIFDKMISIATLQSLNLNGVRDNALYNFNHMTTSDLDFISRVQDHKGLVIWKIEDNSLLNVIDHRVIEWDAKTFTYVVNNIQIIGLNVYLTIEKGTLIHTIKLTHVPKEALDLITRKMKLLQNSESNGGATKAPESSDNGGGAGGAATENSDNGGGAIKLRM